MKSFDSFLHDFKGLAVFDFDDTLAKTGAKVIVKNKNLELDSSEYAKYQIDPSDELDFSQFHTKELIEPVEALERQCRIYRRRINQLGMENVIILTARQLATPIIKFLKRYNLPRVRIFAIDSSNPEKKKRIVKKMIEEHNYSHVFVYDDNVHNLKAIKQLENSNSVTIRTFLIDSSNSTI